MTDRVKLESVAGDSYGVPEAEYGRVIGPKAAPGLAYSHSQAGIHVS